MRGIAGLGLARGLQDHAERAQLRPDQWPREEKKKQPQKPQSICSRREVERERERNCSQIRTLFALPAARVKKCLSTEEGRKRPHSLSGSAAKSELEKV